MKKLILFSLISFSAFANDEIRISYQVSQNQENNQIVFFVKPNEIKRWQNSNHFSDMTDVKLGEMKVDKSDSHKETYKRLAAILSHYKELDQKLAKFKKSWNNTLPNPGPHETTVWINKYRVPSDAYHAKEISEIMSKLIAEKSSLVEGVELVDANKKINYFKNSKVTKTDSYLHPFYCQRKSETKQLCHVKNWGSLTISL